VDRKLTAMNDALAVKVNNSRHDDFDKVPGVLFKVGWPKVNQSSAKRRVRLHPLAHIRSKSSPPVHRSVTR
jgi:hypothetical protein